LVWRSVTDAYCKIPLGDDPADLGPEALNRASTLTLVDFYILKVLLNILLTYIFWKIKNG